MDLFEKTKELGELLLQSPEAQRLELANGVYNLDTEAQNKVKEYNDLQNKFRKMSRKMTKEEVAQAEQELEEIKCSVEAHPVVKESMEAQEEFNNLVSTVIDILNHTIRKDSFKTSAGGGCGGSCGTK